MTALYLAEIEYHDPADASVNKLFWSEDLTQETVWRPFTALHLAPSDPYAKPVVTANAALAPDGQQTADRLTLTTDGTLRQGVSVAANTSYVLSLYVKLGTATNSLYCGVYDPIAKFWLPGYLAPGNAAWTPVNASTWTRVEIPFTTTIERYVEVLLPWHNAAQAGNTLYVWGIDVRQGTSAGAYAKTEGAITRLLRAATVDYTTQAGDTPPLAVYPGRLLQPGLMRRELPMDGGAATVSYGAVELLHDGDLDALAACSFDGLAYTLKTVASGAALATATTVLKASMASAELTRTRLTIRLKDRLQTLDKPVALHTYLGSNTAGSGVEGGPNLKDRRKPVVICDARNITPVLVNEACLIYQAHDGPLLTTGGQTSISVHDGGVPLTQGVVYASLAEMLATAPAAGSFRCYPSLGLFRIWGAPKGALTAYVATSETGPLGWSTSAGALLFELATLAGWPAANVFTADATALDAAYDYRPSYFVSDNASALAVMTTLAAGLGLWFGTDALGRLRIGALAAPSGSAVTTLTDDELLSLERTSNPAQVHSVTARYDKNWTVIEAPFESAPAERRAWLLEEWRQVIEERPAVRVTHPSAKALEVDSYGASSAQARAIAVRLADVHTPGRETFTARVAVSAALLAAIDLNAVVTVQTDRFGLAGGRLLRIIGHEADYRLNRLELTLWG